MTKATGFLLLLLIVLPGAALAEDYSIDLEKIVVTPSKIEQIYKNSTQNTSIIAGEDIKSGGITEITEALDLEEHGFEVIDPPISFCTFGEPGDTPYIFYNDPAKLE